MSTAVNEPRPGGVSRRGLLRAGGILASAGLGSSLLAACTDKGNASPSTVSQSGSASGDTVSLTSVTKGRTIGLLSLDNSAAAVAVGLKYLDSMKDTLGWKTHVIDIQGDPTNVPGGVQTFVSQKVDAIWAYALPGTALGTSFQAATAAKIPVVSLASGRFDGVTHLAEFDEWVSASRIALYVVQRMNFEGELAMLNFNGLTALQIRGAVMKAVLAQYPDVKLVEDLQVKVPGQTDDANAKTAAILGRHPNLKAVWCGWSDVALGANVAVKASGRKNVFVTSIDGVPAELDAIRNGDPLAATCCNDQALIMRIGATVTDTILKGGKLGPSTEQDSPFVDKHNVPGANQQPAGFVTPFWQG